MMNWILLVMGAIVSLVAAILVGGALVPRRYTVSREVLLRASPERVRAALADIGAWPVWMEQASTPIVTDPLAVRVMDDDQRERARLVFTIDAEANGTRVRATDTGEVANLASRLLRHYVSGHAGLLTAVLRGLAEQLDEPGAGIRGD